ncbi:MAG: PDZ domain-containing protein [Candidatus Latescibacteria bacterium]|nr:PDZ domain-containing protein [Candidatus Latescibacterota bacterium]
MARHIWFPFICTLVFTARIGAQPAASLDQLSTSLQNLNARVSPAVVQIFTSGYAPVQGGYLNSAAGLETQHTGGSGVILDPNGYILTNAHVVAGARRVQVLLDIPRSQNKRNSILKPPGRLLGAQVLRFDSETDLAVLKVAETGLPFLPLGDSDLLQPGHLVLAFGSPRGLENSVTFGVVSAKGRQLSPEAPMIYIQTDASINPGNSGGPLVNTKGEVVGINTFILSQSGGHEGIGFAAPSNIVRTVFEQIRDTGRVRRGVIGVHAQTITPILAAGLDLPRDWGVLLGDVYPDGPAAQAGLQVGDIVLRLGGKFMENGRQFNVNLYHHPIGSTVRLDILRDGAEQSMEVEVVERPDDPFRFIDLVDPERNLVPKLGILCLEIDQRIVRMLPRLRHQGAVLVAAIAPGSPAHWRDGFEPGDVIYTVNGTRVHTLPGFGEIIERMEAGSPLILQIERQGRLRYLTLQL